MRARHSCTSNRQTSGTLVREGDSGETGALAGFEDRRIRVRPSRGLSREGLPCFPLVIGQGPDPRCERCCAEQHQGDSITLATLLSGRKPTTTASTRAIGLQIGTARRRASATATSRTPRTGSGAEDDKQNRGCRALLDPLDEGRHLLGLGGRVGHLERHHVDDVERSRRHHPDDDERAPEVTKGHASAAEQVHRPSTPGRRMNEPARNNTAMAG